MTRLGLLLRNHGEEERGGDEDAGASPLHSSQPAWPTPTSTPAAACGRRGLFLEEKGPTC